MVAWIWTISSLNSLVVEVVASEVVDSMEVDSMEIPLAEEREDSITNPFSKTLMFMN